MQMPKGDGFDGMNTIGNRVGVLSGVDMLRRLAQVRRRAVHAAVSNCFDGPLGRFARLSAESWNNGWYAADFLHKIGRGSFVECRCLSGNQRGIQIVCAFLVAKYEFNKGNGIVIFAKHYDLARKIPIFGWAGIRNFIMRFHQNIEFV